MPRFVLASCSLHKHCSPSTVTPASVSSSVAIALGPFSSIEPSILVPAESGTSRVGGKLGDARVIARAGDVFDQRCGSGLRHEMRDRAVRAVRIDEVRFAREGKIAILRKASAQPIAYELVAKELSGATLGSGADRSAAVEE